MKRKGEAIELSIEEEGRDACQSRKRRRTTECELVRRSRVKAGRLGAVSAMWYRSWRLLTSFIVMPKKFLGRAELSDGPEKRYRQ